MPSKTRSNHTKIKEKRVSEAMVAILGPSWRPTSKKYSKSKNFPPQVGVDNFSLFDYFFKKRPHKTVQRREKSFTGPVKQRNIKKSVKNIKKWSPKNMKNTVSICYMLRFGHVGHP